MNGNDMIRNREEKILLKQRLKHFCEQVIEQRIGFAQGAMDDAQAAANGEQKSSAGDKYETARAMGHLEKDMHARQLMAHLRELSEIRSVPTNATYETPQTGALIECKNISFFIAAGLGKQLVDNQPIVFLSPQSPMAKAMANKRTGDCIVFDGELVIVDIF